MSNNIRFITKNIHIRKYVDVFHYWGKKKRLFCNKDMLGVVKKK